MSERRRRALEGWGEADPHRGTWRRNRDWVGRHTILAVLLGGAVAALVGVALLEFVDPLSATPQGNAAAIEQEAMQAAYAAVWDTALAEAIAEARTTALADLVVSGEQGGETEWALGFREGWASGWNEALQAMRQASLDADLPERAPEFYILDSALRR